MKPKTFYYSARTVETIMICECKNLKKTYPRTYPSVVEVKKLAEILELSDFVVDDGSSFIAVELV